MNALLAALIISAPGPKFDSSVGGLSFKREINRHFDSRQKLYAYTGADCDFGHLRLMLTTDLDAILLNEGSIHEGLSRCEIESNREHFVNEFVPKKIDASTNLGVRIGMSESQVTKILGEPKRRFWSKKFQAEELVYERKKLLPKKEREEDGATGIKWTNYYLFRKGRLFYIELCRNYIGGC